MSFDATVGGTGSTSYTTLAAAEAYMRDRLSVESWDAASEDAQQDALIMATARLDQETWKGSMASTTQRLQWPRTGTYDRSGTAYATTVIPRPVQEATAELALAMLNDPTAFAAESGLREFEHLSIGSLSITPRTGALGSALPRLVLQLIVTLRVGGFMGRVVRA